MQFTPPCYCETQDEYYYYSQGLEPPYDPFDGVDAVNVSATAASTAAAATTAQGGQEAATVASDATAASSAPAASAIAASASAPSHGSDKLPFREFGTCLTQPKCTGGVPWTAQHSVRGCCVFLLVSLLFEFGF